MNRRNAEHFTGCMLGGAIGDAMGAPIEFLSLAKIRGQYGADGVTDISDVVDDDALAKFTDDTQMSLFTAEGIIRATNRFDERGICNPIAVIHHAYVRWLHTQGEIAGIDFFEDVEDDGWLIKIPTLHARRAPGNTCISALKSGEMSHRERSPINNSKGCGGVMRVAPVGLFVYPERVFKMGCEVAAITHGHPTGFLSAGYLASLISSIIKGKSLEDAIEDAIQELVEQPEHEECLEAIRCAISLAKNPSVPREPEAVESLGEGWVAEEALAISLYASLVAGDDFAAGIRLAINHGGDSDSTGAITGNILGSLLGRNSIPRKWVEMLELYKEIEEIAVYMLTKPKQRAINLEMYPGW